MIIVLSWDIPVPKFPVRCVSAIAGMAEYLDNLGGTIYTFTRGNKLFKLSNHLGKCIGYDFGQEIRYTGIVHA